MQDILTEDQIVALIVIYIEYLDIQYHRILTVTELKYSLYIAELYLGLKVVPIVTTYSKFLSEWKRLNANILNDQLFKRVRVGRKRTISFNQSTKERINRWNDLFIQARLPIIRFGLNLRTLADYVVKHSPEELEMMALFAHLRMQNPHLFEEIYYNALKTSDEVVDSRLSSDAVKSIVSSLVRYEEYIKTQ